MACRRSNYKRLITAQRGLWALSVLERVLNPELLQNDAKLASAPFTATKLLSPVLIYWIKCPTLWNSPLCSEFAYFWMADSFSELPFLSILCILFCIITPYGHNIWLLARLGHGIFFTSSEKCLLILSFLLIKTIVPDILNADEKIDVCTPAKLLFSFALYVSLIGFKVSLHLLNCCSNIHYQQIREPDSVRIVPPRQILAYPCNKFADDEERNGCNIRWCGRNKAGDYCRKKKMSTANAISRIQKIRQIGNERNWAVRATHE